MSSHHIVKEKQEPALLILDLQGFDPENLGQLLEWSPSVIVAADAYDEAESLGIKIDFLVGSQDKHLLQPRTRIVPAEGNVLSEAMEFLVHEKYPAVNIINSTTEISEYLPYCEKINIVVLTARNRIFMVRSGFSKWKPAGEDIQILSDVTQLTHSGLEQTTSTTFKTTLDGFYSLQFQEPFIFIAENL